MKEQIIPLDNINKRFIKFKFNNKCWTKEIYFNNEKNLIKFIKEKNPSDCYFSLSTFFNKKRLYKSDLVLDFDNVKKENILKSIEVFGIPSYILQTSKTHFQLLYKNIPLKDSELWLNKIKENNIEVDESVIKDRECRVCRLPYPQKRHNGFIPKLLSLEDLKNFNYEIVPKEKDVKKKEFYFYRAIKSNINKKDLQVLVIKNPSIPRLKKIQNIYNIGNIYLIDFPKDRYAISIKLFSKSRLLKIYKAYGIKWKHNFKFIRTSEKMDNNENIFEGGIQKISVLEGSNKGLFSLPHIYLISHFIEVPKYLNYIGKQEIPVYEIKNFGVIQGD